MAVESSVPPDKQSGLSVADESDDELVSILASVSQLNRTLDLPGALTNASSKLTPGPEFDASGCALECAQILPRFGKSLPFDPSRRLD